MNVVALLFVIVFAWWLSTLGISSSLEPLRAFAEFDGLHLGDFSARAQVVSLSPLRLPIPPLGHRVLKSSIGSRDREGYVTAGVAEVCDLLPRSRI
jgi:hypothetical protein